ncbi:MAG TPA: iron-sulfur cluster assembly scaffold protein [Rhizomicrobium sp.]
MSDPLYRRELIRLAADAHGAGTLPAPDVTGSAFNPACGDRVSVTLTLSDGRITGVGHETRACVLTQASASILGSALEGHTRADVEVLRAALVRMLATDGPPPGAPFDVYSVFDGVAGHPARHRCVLLPVDAVLGAFGKCAEPGGERSER